LKKKTRERGGKFQGMRNRRHHAAIRRIEADIIQSMKRGFLSVWLLVLMLGASASAQTPQPFPRPGDSPKPQPSGPPPGTSKPDAQGLKVLPPTPPPAAQQAPPGAPTEATLGMPIYPGAKFIDSYDAGRGQRYYLFGATADFAQIVTFYRTTLKQRGELIFEVPAIHMFEVGRFREETMAFPPGVTVKDYSPDGYLNPKPGNPTERFRTIIQIVPSPPGAAVK
jgi:hypothetical protein